VGGCCGAVPPGLVEPGFPAPGLAPFGFVPPGLVEFGFELPGDVVELGFADPFGAVPGPDGLLLPGLPLLGFSSPGCVVDGGVAPGLFGFEEFGFALPVVPGCVLPPGWLVWPGEAWPELPPAGGDPLPGEDCATTNAVQERITSNISSFLVDMRNPPILKSGDSRACMKAPAHLDGVSVSAMECSGNPADAVSAGA
jgi:hypothetical protein